MDTVQKHIYSNYHSPVSWGPKSHEAWDPSSFLPIPTDLRRAPVFVMLFPISLSLYTTSEFILYTEDSYSTFNRNGDKQLTDYTAVLRHTIQ
jgi:hypothetical protein